MHCICAKSMVEFMPKEEDDLTNKLKCCNQDNGSMPNRHKQMS